MARFTIEGVAERSGAAKTTIYRWWPSKGVLAMEAYHSEVAATLSITDGPSAIADLHKLLHLMAQVFASTTGRVLAGLIAEGQTDPDTLAAYREGVLEPASCGGASSAANCAGISISTQPWTRSTARCWRGCC